ncbi:hypothetical protein [Novosphingobium humi]|uniref:Bacteriophage lambda head decoration protein D n=1 Tax=Novosphingobium humi TaxID=2282397 RepID=A0ABY7U0X0_9SPHN|nr:hypothetical protein [Novosphingobium humi]WCT78863.1 hypothetical protein PQ457_07875 [Novosphingobium humi]
MPDLTATAPAGYVPKGYDVSFGLKAPAYYQVTVSAAAKTLAQLIGAAVPDWATMAFITPETGSIRYRCDGNAPTATVGQPVGSGQSWPLTGASALAAAQLIAAADTTVSIEFRG